MSNSINQQVYNEIDKMTESNVLEKIKEIITKIKNIANNHSNDFDLPFDNGYNGVLWVESELRSYETIFLHYKEGVITYFSECENIEEIEDLLYEKSNEYIYYCLWFLNLGGKRNKDVQNWLDVQYNNIN